MPDDPGDAFAPRPEHAASATHRVIQLHGGRPRLSPGPSSELEAALRSRCSIDGPLEFRDLDPTGRDDGDIDWCDPSRALRIESFRRTRFSDDWNQFLPILRHVPTALDGFARLVFEVGGETLAFRKPVRRQLWRIRPRYFWVHARLRGSARGRTEAPLLLEIDDPNDFGEMNGSYLVVPRGERSTPS